MPIRNGIYVTLRAKGRTALFTLLILILTVALTLGAGMWIYCAQLLDRFDDTYTSIVIAEYMGEDYPDENAADEQARAALSALDDEAIAAVGGVTLWERVDRAPLLTDGYKRPSNTSPYSGYGVVVATRLFPLYSTGWGVSPAADTVLTEERIVIDTSTWDGVYYMPGLEPLELHLYFYLPNSLGADEYVSSPEYRGNTVSFGESISADELPERYLLGELFPDVVGDYTHGITVEGGLPEGYNRAAPVYYYSPVLDAYEFYGEHISGYNGSISRSIYTADGREGVLAVFDFGTTGFVPERGKRYLLHGQFVSGGASNRTFAVTDFYEGCETAPWLELTGEDDPALTDSIFIEYAGRYRYAASFVQAEASRDIASLEAFQQGTQYLTEGRFPEAGETGVCVISGSTAEQMQVGLGDTVSVSVLAADTENRYDLAGTGDLRTWEIVGITNPSADYSGWFWVPDAEGGFPSPLFGYELGRMVLDNRSAVQTMEKLQELMPDGVRLTLYDQGYSAAAEPIQAMRTTAIAITAAAVLGALAVLFLFAYLFIGRQRETVQVLVSLGTPARKIRLWFLSGTSLIAFFAAALGAAVGSLALDRIIARALDIAERLYAVDIRYSNAALGLLSETPQAAEVSAWYAAATAAAVFAAALVFCLVFLRYARRENTPRKGKSSVRMPKGKTSLMGRGAGRFALLSARRGGWRSVVVPVTALVLTLLLGLLTAGASGWEGQLEELYSNSALEGQVVSANGRSATKLSVSADTVRELYQTGQLEEVAVSLGWNYWFRDEMPQFAGTAFGDESRSAWIRQQPELIALNSLSAAPEFYYAETPEVEWLDGWDETFLSESDYIGFMDRSIPFDGVLSIPPYPVLVSRAFLEEHGLALGDWTRLFIRIEFQNSRTDTDITIRIVGTFQPVGQKQNIYAPLGCWFDPAWITGDTTPLAEGEMVSLTGRITNQEQLDKLIYFTTNFRACRFTLKSAYDLEDFRQVLADGNYSQVGKLTSNRTTVLLLDQAFQETVGGLGRYISFSRILFPVLLAAVALMGFIISWLMVNGRRMEFAILRGLGTSRRQVFASFFLEQGALCVAGCLTGALALTVLRPVPAVWLAAAGFLGCYLFGCALSIMAVGRIKLMTLLSERE